MVKPELDKPNFVSFLRAFIAQNRLLIILSASVVLFIFTFTLAITKNSRQDVIASDKKSINVSNLPKVWQSSITVDVAGAVIKPGVYQLATDSRVQDAVVAAGGFDIDKVDSSFVAKQLNLATKLTDGQKIYILHKGEDIASVPNQYVTVASAKKTLNINAASATELTQLPNITASIAKKIIDNRPYTTVNDLKTKKLVNATVFNGIQQLIDVH